ncbi:hypothetical protein Goshw_015824, partial [Gossypium schwendimanii]|nr:hypothetical protein [Gossypium schwendimanii]
QWQSISPEIKAVLNRTEEKQIKGEDEGVKNWLDDIQDLAYDVDDILDEFAYQQLHLKLQKPQSQASTSKVQKLIPTCCTDHVSRCNFQGKETQAATNFLDGWSFGYVGRANEKQEMLELLKIKNSDGVCVLSIVGMGGMGENSSCSACLQ